MHFARGGVRQARRKSAERGLTGGPLSMKHLRSAGLVLEPRLRTEIREAQTRPFGQSRAP